MAEAAERPARPSEDPNAQFSDATLLFEVDSVKHLRTGLTQVIVMVPYEAKGEAVKLTSAYGLLLEASVRRKGE